MILSVKLIKSRRDWTLMHRYGFHQFTTQSGIRGFLGTKFFFNFGKNFLFINFFYHSFLRQRTNISFFIILIKETSETYISSPCTC